MKQAGFSLLIIAYLTHSAVGQNKTYIGFEFAVANDIYKISDQGSFMKSIPLYNTTESINLRQEINKTIFIETGVIFKYYKQALGFKITPVSLILSGDPSWLVPMRFGMNVNLYKQRIYFVPIIGYTFGINPPNRSGLPTYSYQKSTTDIINYNYAENSSLNRYFSLLHTGAGFEFKISNAFLLHLSASYYKGFKTTTELNISYTVNNAAPVAGSAISKGDFWSISTGFKYAISNLWKRG